MPYAAASLTVGALALLVGSLLTPATAGAAESLSIVRENDGRWLGVSALLLFGSVTMTLGLPSLLTLIGGRAARLGLVALCVMAVGTILTSGYAVLLVFYRALVLTDSLTGPIEDLSTEPGIAGFLAVFLGAFFGGELLLGLALLLGGSVRPWIPALLLVHAATPALNLVVPVTWQGYEAFLLAAGFSGLAITANERAAQRRLTG